MPFPPLQFPGEPDALTEVRLRAELKLLRSAATMLQRTEIWTRPELLKPKTKEEIEKLKVDLSPEMEAELKRLAEEYWEPTAVAERIVIRAPLERIKPGLRARLLKLESYFVEKGWRLPRWERPSWLLE